MNHVEARLGVPTPEIRAESLPADVAAACERHVVAGSLVRLVLRRAREVPIAFIYGLFVEPGVHFAGSFLSPGEVLSERAVVGDGFEEVLIVYGGVSELD